MAEQGIQNRYEKIIGIISGSVLDDYYTAAVKSEVTLDMLITPVISDLISIAKDINLRYITKEFPLVTGESGLRSAKADYLLCDNRTIYLVELKTSMDSVVDAGQIERYERLIRNNPKFFDQTLDYNDICDKSPIGNWFIKLVNDKLSEYWRRYRVFPEKSFVSLKELADQIYGRKNDDRKDDIRHYLKNHKKRGTIKYQTQVNQIASSDENLIDKEIQVYYLIPELTADVEKNLQEFCVITFCSIVKKWKGFTSEEKEKYANYEYLDWLITDILEKLFDTD